MFDIREHLDKFEIIQEINTQVSVRCPCCDGKIVISKSKGAYQCVTELCNTSDIRKALGFSSNEYQKKESYPNVISFPKNIQLNKIENYIDESFYSIYYSNKYKCEVLRTTYIYDDNHRIVVLKGDNLEKACYPSFKNKDGEWIYAVNDSFPFFNHQYLKNGYFVFVTEGEKAANVLTLKTGYVAISPPGGWGWNDDWLKYNICHNYFNCEGFVYLPDNDSVGTRKANQFQKSAWEVGKPCKILNLSSFYKYKSDDIVDILNYGIDIKEIIKGIKK